MMMNKIYKPGFLSLLLLLMFSAGLDAQTQKITTTAACRLFADIENVSSVLSYVPKGKELNVVEFSGDYVLVEYEETKGWIRADKTNAAPVLTDDSYETPAEISTYTPQRPNDRYSILVEKYGLRTGKALFEHKIWKGIDNNMVKDSWGKPLNVSREVNTSGTIEIWTYRKSWLLMKNGILSEWGPNK